MIKKQFRLFWSYDVPKTEQWLSSMSRQGYHLVRINLHSRHFFFQKGEGKAITYQIIYDRKQGDFLPSALVNNGWVKVFAKGSWCVVRNDRPLDEIKALPAREGLIRRNKLLMYVFGSAALYQFISAFMMVTTFSVLLSNVVHNVEVNVVPSPFWFVTPFIFIALVLALIWLIYSILKLYTANQRFVVEEGTSVFFNSAASSITRFSKGEERQLRRKGEMIVKRKFGWMYSPDTLETWLEEMEEQGYNLYRVNSLGSTFFFLKGTPRRVAYCIDYQNTGNQRYFDLHTESSWKLVFTTMGSLSKWTIWSQEYKTEDNPPQFYSDRPHLLHHARRIAITYSCLFLPLIFIYVSSIRQSLGYAWQQGFEGFDWVHFAVFGISIIVFSMLTIRTWLYYARLKNQALQ